MNNKLTAVNKDILVWARNYYDLSQEEVSSRNNVPLDRLREWEAGTESPTYAQLKKLSDYYRKPIIVFFMDKIPNQSIYDIACRTNPNIAQNHNDKKIREMFDLANVYKLNLEEIYSNEEKVNFYKLLEDENISFENFHSWLRIKLKLSIEYQKRNFNSSALLLEYIRKSFYDIGIYIFKDSFRTNSISGLCLFDPNYPVILLNNKMSFTRQLFTVFHEVYHLFYKKADLESINYNQEQECDKFASEFLLPGIDFNQRISHIQYFEDEYLISDLSLEYKVSRDAICYRLQKLNKISPQFYTEIREKFMDDVRVSMSKSSGGNFYTTKMNYLGKSYLNQVVSSYYSGKLTIQQVGRFTNLKTYQVSTLASTMTGGKL